MKFIPSSVTVNKGIKIVLLFTILLLNLGLGSTSVAYAAAPTHDNFADAKVISGITFLDLNVDTTEATQQELSQPNGADPDNVACEGNQLNAGQNTVWYTYTPSISESISVDSLGSDYDTYIAVWTGTESNLSLVACDDDTFGGLQSELTFVADPGVTYYIEVAQFNGYYPSADTLSNGGTLQFHAYISNLDVYVGPIKQDSYYLSSNNVLIDFYGSLLDGPVKVTSTTSDDIFTSQRVTSGDSYNELMGYAADQLTTEYWFPYYDHGYPNVPGSKMRTWILVGNADDTLTAEVEVYIGGVLQPVPGTSNPVETTFSIPPGANVTPRWVGTRGGPVRVVSTNAVPIFASKRVFTVPNNAFNENLGYPANQFTTEYWFPWYDDVNMTNNILVGNTSSSQSANVEIYIAGVLKTSTSIPPNGVIQPRYVNQIGGPVQVRSTNGVDIVTSQKSVSTVGTTQSYSEVIGYPFDQFTTEYWFPWYDHGYPNVFGSKMRTWVLVGNPSSTDTANVQIYIGGVLQPVPGTSNPVETTFSIPPGANVTPRWIGTQAGPVHVVSDIPVFASERVFTVPNNVFNEAMGVPNDKLATEYWYPWYDSINMKNELLVSKP